MQIHKNIKILLVLQFWNHDEISCLFKSFENVYRPSIGNKIFTIIFKVMRKKRRYLCSVSLGTKLYAIGGYDGSRRLNSVECYDVTKQEWTPSASMIHRRGLAGAAVLNGKFITKILRRLSYLLLFCFDIGKLHHFGCQAVAYCKLVLQQSRTQSLVGTRMVYDCLSSPML